MKLLLAILLGGLAAGVLDITYAFVVYGPMSYQLSPMHVLQSVDAGWIGREAANAGGWTTAIAGLATHFMLATIIAAIFVLAAARLPMLTTNAWFWGLFYGLIVYVMMNFVVAPLSAARAGHFASSLPEVMERLHTAFFAERKTVAMQTLGTIFTHTAFVGIPIALINKRVAGKQ